MQRMSRRRLGLLTVALGFWIAATAVFLWPLISHIGSSVTSALDGPLYVWTLETGRRVLAKDPRDWFEANIFFPHERARALADHLFGYQPLYAPLAWLLGSPVTATNGVLLLTFPLTAIAMSFLAWTFVGDAAAAFLVATILAFSPQRMAQLGHVHMMGFFWTPLAMGCTWRWLKTGKGRYVWLTTLCFCLQLLSAWYLGYFGAISIAITVIVGIRRQALARLRAVDVVGCAALLAAVLVLTSPPYIEVAAEYHEQQSPLGLISRISADAVYSYVSAAPGSLLYGRTLGTFPLGDFAWEKRLFPGAICLGLAAMTFFVRWRHDERRGVRCGRWLTGAGFLLSLGPYLTALGRTTAVPLPYLALYHWVPGFGSIRTPARLGFITNLGLALLATYGFSEMIRRLRLGKCTSWATAVVVSVCVVAEGYQDIQTSPVPTEAEIPAYVRWLRQRPLGVLLELPLGEEKHLPNLERQVMVMYRSLYHSHLLANGYSSFTPPQLNELTEHARRLPDPRELRYVRVWGITELIVHPATLSYGRFRGQPIDAKQVLERKIFPDGVIALALRNLVPRKAKLRLSVERAPPIGAKRWASVTVVFSNVGENYWRGPGRRSVLRYAWRGAGDATLLEGTAKVRPPVVLAPGESRSRTCELRVPPRLNNSKGPIALEVECVGARTRVLVPR